MCIEEPTRELVIELTYLESHQHYELKIKD